MISRVVILNDASVARGGATGLALLSIRLLRARGYEVTYIVGDDGANDELRDLGVEVVAVGGRQLVKQNAAKAFASGLYNAHARDVVSHWIARHDGPGVVYHLHGWSKILSPSIFSALAPVAGRTVVHAHDFFLSCPNGAFMDYPHEEPCERVPLGLSCLKTNCDKRNYVQKLWRVGRRRILSSTFQARGGWSRVLMIHPKMAAYLAKGGVPRDLLVAVRNPAEPFTRERVRAEDNETILFIGRVEAEKGIQELIAGVRRTQSRLAVIGDGPLRERLERENPDIRFLGWRSGPEIAAVLREARAVVMPSRYPEPFGLVAAEASQSGVPMLVSNTAFVSDEIVEHGVGYAFDVTDPTDVAQALQRIRELPRADVEAMSHRAFSNIAKLSSTPDAWIGQLIGLYEAAAEAGGAPSAQRALAAGR